MAWCSSILIMVKNNVIARIKTTWEVIKTDSVKLMKRAMVFIDGANVFHSCKNFRHGYKIDYVKLRDELTKDYDLIRVYYYSGVDPSDVPSRSFHKALKAQGFHVETRPLVERNGKLAEKGIDVMLTTELLTHAFKDNFDVAVIVGGDQDYIVALREVKREGKRIVVACFRNSFSNEIQEIADESVFIDNIAERVEK
ncbi:MAG TPA: NYN domain-containing protein [Methanosarcinales archaeon]|nr:NYN domain-containing protein [Methanosarcinales archaeon]